MNVTPTTPKMDTAKCPHGNPVGACPICAGLSGGGGGLANNKARVAGEWTYDQCYTVWQQMLKAKATAEDQKLQQKMDYAKAQAKIQTFAEKIMDKIAQLNAKAMNITAPNQTLISRVEGVLAATVVIAANVVTTAVNIVRNTFDFVQQKFIDISDKLNAIYGELKLKIEKFLSEKTSIKEKLKSLFEIFVPLDVDNEQKKIDEEKMLNKIRTTLDSIKERFTKKHKEVEDDKAG